MTQQEIIRDIKTYEARERRFREELDKAIDPKYRSELERMLHAIALILSGLSDELMEAMDIDVAGHPQRTALDPQRRA